MKQNSSKKNVQCDDEESKCKFESEKRFSQLHQAKENKNIIKSNCSPLETSFSRFDSKINFWLAILPFFSLCFSLRCFAICHFPDRHFVLRLLAAVKCKHKLKKQFFSIDGLQKRKKSPPSRERFMSSRSTRFIFCCTSLADNYTETDSKVIQTTRFCYCCLPG